MQIHLTLCIRSARHFEYDDRDIFGLFFLFFFFRNGYRDCSRISNRFRISGNIANITPDSKVTGRAIVEIRSLFSNGLVSVESWPNAPARKYNSNATRMHARIPGTRAHTRTHSRMHARSLALSLFTIVNSTSTRKVAINLETRRFRYGGMKRCAGLVTGSSWPVTARGVCFSRDTPHCLLENTVYYCREDKCGRRKKKTYFPRAAHSAMFPARRVITRTRAQLVIKREKFFAMQFRMIPRLLFAV